MLRSNVVISPYIITTQHVNVPKVSAPGGSPGINSFRATIPGTTCSTPGLQHFFFKKIKDLCSSDHAMYDMNSANVPR